QEAPSSRELGDDPLPTKHTVALVVRCPTHGLAANLRLSPREALAEHHRRRSWPSRRTICSASGVSRLASILRSRSAGRCSAADEHDHEGDQQLTRTQFWRGPLRHPRLNRVTAHDTQSAARPCIRFPQAHPASPHPCGHRLWYPASRAGPSPSAATGCGTDPIPAARPALVPPVSLGGDVAGNGPATVLVATTLHADDGAASPRGTDPGGAVDGARAVDRGHARRAGAVGEPTMGVAVSAAPARAGAAASPPDPDATARPAHPGHAASAGDHARVAPAAAL